MLAAGQEQRLRDEASQREAAAEAAESAEAAARAVEMIELQREVNRLQEENVLAAATLQVPAMHPPPW